MPKHLLPKIAYFKIDQAAITLNCKVSDIIHWAANEKTTLYLRLKQAESAVILRNPNPTSPSSTQHFGGYHDPNEKLIQAVLKVISGEMGLSHLSFNDVRPKTYTGDVPIFYNFTYAGRSFPLTMMAKASGLWALGPSFAKHLENHGNVPLRPFFLEHGYVLNPHTDIDGLQLCIVPVTSPEDLAIPDIDVIPEDLWLSHDSMQQLLNKSDTKPTLINEGLTKSNTRYSRKKHAMLCLLIELLTKHDSTFAGIVINSQNLTSTNYELLIDQLHNILRIPKDRPEPFMQNLFIRCAQSGAAFISFTSKNIYKWPHTTLADDILKIIDARPQDEIQLQLASINKNTVKQWIKKPQSW